MSLYGYYKPIISGLTDQNHVGFRMRLVFGERNQDSPRGLDLEVDVWHATLVTESEESERSCPYSIMSRLQNIA